MKNFGHYTCLILTALPKPEPESLEFCVIDKGRRRPHKIKKN